MTLHASGLEVVGTEHGIVPVVLLVPVVHRLPLFGLGCACGTVICVLEAEALAGAAVTNRAADLVDRMRRLGCQVEVEARVGQEGVVECLPVFGNPILIVAGAVDGLVAGLAHVDAPALGEVQLEGKVGEDLFLNAVARIDEVESGEVAHDVGQAIGGALGVEAVEFLLQQSKVLGGALDLGLDAANLGPIRRDLLFQGLDHADLDFDFALDSQERVEGHCELVRAVARVLFVDAVFLDHEPIPGEVLLGRFGLFGNREKHALLGEERRTYTVPVRSPGIQAYLGVGQGGLQGRGRLVFGLHGRRLNGLADALGLDLAKHNLVRLPGRVPVIDHHPDGGEQQEDAGEREPAVEAGSVIMSVAAIRHGSRVTLV